MIIFEGSEEQFKCYFDDSNYIVLTDEMALHLVNGLKRGIIDQWNTYLIVDDYNLVAFSDYKFIKEAIHYNSYFYKFASTEIQNDLNIVKAAVTDPGIMIDYSLEGNNATPLEYIPEKYRDDEDIITIALQEDPNALKFASQRLKSSREFVVKAMNINSYHLVNASSELRNDKNLVRKIINDGGWFLFAYYCEDSKSLLCDRDFTCFASGAEFFDYIGEDLKSDREFVLEMVKDNGCILLYTNDELRNDRELILAAVSSCEFVFENLAPIFQDDKEIVAMAVKKSGDLIKFASDRLKKDQDIATIIVGNNHRPVE